MNTKDLSYFRKAYKYKNIRIAAESCYITPQGMSKIIQKLEAELGVPLFVRTKAGVEPTIYGDILYENSKTMIETLENLKDQIVSMGNERYRELTIAMTLGVIDYLSADFILDFQKQHPQIKLSIAMNPDYRVDEMVNNDEAEIGIVMGPVDVTRYEGQLFTSHRHCLIIPDNHPLAEKKAISYQDLDGEPFAIVCKEFMAYHNNLNRFLSAEVMPKIIYEVSEIETIHTFAEQHRGIGMTVDFAAFARERKGAVIRPLADEACKLESFLITKKGKILSLDAQLFYDYAVQWIKDHKDNFFVWNPDID